MSKATPPEKVVLLYVLRGVVETRIPNLRDASTS